MLSYGLASYYFVYSYLQYENITSTVEKVGNVFMGKNSLFGI